MAQKLITVTIPQRFVAFDPVEWRQWRQGPVDSPMAIEARRCAVDAVLRETGSMGRARDTYDKQALFRKRDGSEVSHNYSEAKTAQIVLARELKCSPQSGIFYENYRMSRERCEAERNGNLVGHGIAAIERVFEPIACQWYDELFDANYGAQRCFTPRKSERRTKAAVTDLFGYSKAQRLCGFWETKTYPPESNRHEGILPHQALMLSIIRHLADTHWERILRPLAGVDAILTEFVVLHPLGHRPSEPPSLTFELDVTPLDA